MEESSYQKVKKENEELHKQFDWLNDDAFLLSTEADMKQVYMYLKTKPEAAKFIFRKYADLRETIKEICDPDNPLFLPKVKENLSDLIEFEESKENLEEIRSQINKYSLDLDRLKEEISENEKAFDEIESELKAKIKEKDELDRLSANIRADPGLEKISSYISQTKTILETIIKKSEKYQKEHPFLPEVEIDLTRDQIMNIKGMVKGADELKTYIESNDFLSNDYLDEERKKIRELIEKEKEQTKKEVDIVKEMNPVHRIKKINEGINLVLNQLDQGDPIDGGIVTFRRTGIGIIKNNLMDVQDLVQNMELQFRNIRNGEKRNKVLGVFS
ncbi:hypothetical protein ACNF42_06670 [Cuniculiplasma sp. SKW3]|uniref:hypothetical protein n=1 Tax=Cuniculiplasma sp. SKW3 TaxID=3400170 RepID=UPI003FD14E93